MVGERSIPRIMLAICFVALKEMGVLSGGMLGEAYLFVRFCSIPPYGLYYTLFVRIGPDNIIYFSESIRRTGEWTMEEL